MWLFLAVEGVPLAAEESGDPARDMPRGIITSMLVLLVLGALVLFLAPGGSSAALMKRPCRAARRRIAACLWRTLDARNVRQCRGTCGSHRELFLDHLRLFAPGSSRCRVPATLPRWLSLTGRRNVPALALIVPGVIGFLLSLTGAGDLMITMAVFGATISYAMMMLSHIILRYREPDMARPYRTPGGVVVTGIALFLSLLAFASTFVVSYEGGTVVGRVLRGHGGLLCDLQPPPTPPWCARAPEEEFAAIARAEAELR